MGIIISIPDARITALENRGREREGSVSMEDIMEFYPHPEEQVEDLDKLFLALAEARIDIIDAGMDDSDREAAFTFVYRNYQWLVFGKALGMLQDLGLAEDVSQEVFLSVWRTGRMLQSKNGLVAWLLQVTKNKVIDVIRARKSRVEEVPLEENQRVYGIDETVVTRIDVSNMLRVLPALQRDIVKLMYFEGRPAIDVAQQLNESPNTIASRKRLALIKLREHERIN